MAPPKFILEINTRVWLRTLGLGTSPSLREIPDYLIDEWLRWGFDAVWLMGVWLPSPAGEQVARTLHGLREEYARALPAYREEDVACSPYAIRGYEVNPEWGGDAALIAFRRRLNERGLKLILDFIPNHVARDHPWVYDHPDWIVQGARELAARAPQNWFTAETCEGPRLFAHGRDPHFDGWSDTAQLDYRRAELRAAMQREVEHIADLCDGVRCDVAMLVLNDVFRRSWGELVSLNGGHAQREFWDDAIRAVRTRNPDFTFIAEVYWGLDGRLRELGFDLTYDKQLLDDLISGALFARGVQLPPSAQLENRLHFLENHDEPRIASRMDSKRVAAAAAWLFSLPGSKLIYHGQFSGKRVRLPVQLLREPDEAVDSQLRAAYDKIMRQVTAPVFRFGNWRALSPRPSWLGNESHHGIHGQAFDFEDRHARVFVNWSESRSQCWVDLLLGPLQQREVVLRDAITGKVYVRQGMELMMRGLYLDMEPFEAHIFDCEIRAQS